MRPSEVFLSHAAVDRPFATSLAESIRRHGVPVWYSETDIRGAQQWHDEIGAALDRCDWFLLVLSPAAVESMWVKRELLCALEERRFERRIVSVDYRACEFKKLSWVLSQYQFIDCQRDHESGIRELLRIWGIGYRPEGEGSPA